VNVTILCINLLSSVVPYITLLSWLKTAFVASAVFVGRLFALSTDGQNLADRQLPFSISFHWMSAPWHSKRGLLSRLRPRFWPRSRGQDREQSCKTEVNNKFWSPDQSGLETNTSRRLSWTETNVDRLDLYVKCNIYIVNNDVELDSD